MTISRTRATLSTLLFMAACGQPTSKAPAPTEGQGQSQQAILGGQDSGPEQDYLVMVRTNPGGVINGSGVLVAPNLVLTALHITTSYDDTFTNEACALGGEGIKVFTPEPPDTLQVYAGSTFPGPKVKGQFPIKKIIPLPVIDVCDGDLSFILLEGDLTGVPIAPIRLDGPAKVDEAAFAVGWGTFSTDGSIPKIRQTRDISVLALGPGQYQIPDGLPVNLREGQLVATNGPCYGDSGSGIFSKESGALIGVVSRGQAKNATTNPTLEEPAKLCQDSLTVCSRIDPFKDFILSAFKEANHAPWREGKPKPGAFGEACAEALDCDQMRCVVGRCSRPCDSDPCPEGYECAQGDGEKVCKSLEVGAGGAAGSAGAAGTAGAAGEGGQSTGAAQGTACTKPSDCASGLCIELDGGLCTERCDAATPCAGGWECSPLGDKSVCVPPAKPATPDEGCAAHPGAPGGAWWGLALLLALGRCRRRR